MMERRRAGKAEDDLVFTTAARSHRSFDLRWAGGRPIHHGDFHKYRWTPAVEKAMGKGLAFRPRICPAPPLQVSEPGHGCVDLCSTPVPRGSDRPPGCGTRRRSR
jgi:hypothetical protein